MAYTKEQENDLAFVRELLANAFEFHLTHTFEERYTAQLEVPIMLQIDDEDYKNLCEVQASYYDGSLALFKIKLYAGVMDDFYYYHTALSVSLAGIAQTLGLEPIDGHEQNAP